MGQMEKTMDDVSKLGPLWVAQLTKEVAHRRNRATESLLTISQEGDFAKQHLMLIGAANAMLAAPQLVAALEMVRDADNDARTDGLPHIPSAARASIDAALAAAGA